MNAPGLRASTPRVAVIGGSLGGLFAALALRRAGFPVEVYERSTRPLHGRGAGLRMQADMVQRLREAQIEVAASTLAPSRFRFLGLHNEVTYEEETEIRYTSWSRLYDLLLEALGRDRYHLGMNAVGLTQHPTGATVRFGDSSSYDADVVVAADGLTSDVRQWLAPADVPRYAGYVCWRGIVDQRELSAGTLRLLSDAGVYVMPERGHMSIYPIPRQGAGCDYNVVWYRVVPASLLPDLLVDSRGEQRQWSVPAGAVKHADIEALHAAATRELPDAAAEVIRKIPQPFIQVIVDVESSRMVHGRVCWIADAAFGGRPHLGAGTAKAAADAWTLASALAAHPHAADHALAEWEAGRMALGRRYVQTNRDLGDSLVAGDISPQEFTRRASWQKLLEAGDSRV
ncbi:MAG: FAD-dependent monooxygenase [Lautropia sp.]